jgi:hypothetical protein
MAKKSVITEKKDSRAIPADEKKGLPKSLQHEFHTINIAEQEGELPYVDVFVSGTVKGAKKGEEMPFARNFQIRRGEDVMNVPKMVVHVLMDTAIETRYRQEVRTSPKDGTKRNAFIPFKKKSYPCTIVESYDEKKAVDEDGHGLENEREADVMVEE